MLKGATSVVAVLSACPMAVALDLTLGLPLDCEVGRTCFVQNYVDHDASNAARDYACGAQTYDTHNGTDFRLPDRTKMKEGVSVLAAADGRVLRFRDGVADVSIRERSALRGQECGNGVVVAHEGGWETQYCHMQQGSIAVKPGSSVKAGERLGRVGLSGHTEFAHLHFTVRKDGKVVDPFAYGAPEGMCKAGVSLWAPAVQTAIGYRQAAILNQGFAGKPITVEDVESGEVEAANLRTDAHALVAYVRAIGLSRGDVLRLVVVGPDGRSFADNTVLLDANKAQYFLMTGRKRPLEGWKNGIYRATFSVHRSGALVREASFEITL